MENFNEQDLVEMEIEEYLGEPVPDDFVEKDKGRAKRRKTDAKKAIRKKKLATELYTTTVDTKEWEYYNNLHQYSKNKIHCSCPICRAKTKKKKNELGSFHRNGKNWKHSDLQKIESAKDKEKESE